MDLAAGAIGIQSGYVLAAIVEAETERQLRDLIGLGD
jgi:hypothetical protein